ncbi:sensor histidine kinase [Paraconexibacter algicola]|uniref:histidine kinase n=1 Tax=Paraconexibacter algicola TaxID=2133960 RepID=A0A2T4UDB1_9ACTN|nr:sensor histidine kinase [Paraconexibacter algicola]PTL55484.1 hypothetical protein C7Y72_17685 [Paraconexibacter algicola]
MTVSLLGWLLASASALTLVVCRVRAHRRDVALARASHEVRGPLQAVMLGLAGLDRIPPDGVGERARVIGGELDRVVAALADLDAARARRAAAPGRHVRPVGAGVDLAALVRRQVAAWQPVAGARGRTLRWEGAQASCPVPGEEVRLAQATGNLLANALEHGRGEVVVQLVREAGAVRIIVRDEGPGPGVPVERLLARARRGTGAHGHGLAVAHAVALAHGGRLSAPPGDGVALVLPAAVADGRLVA